MKPRKLLTLLLAAAVFFTNIAFVSTSVSATLLPLEEIDAVLYLEGFSDEELEAVPVEYMLNNMVYAKDYIDKDGVRHSSGESITIADDAVAAVVSNRIDGKYKYTSNYQLLNRTDTFSFRYSSLYQYTMMVGSSKQLDTDNVFYNVYCIDPENYYNNKVGYDLSFYIPPAEEGGERTVLKTKTNSYSYNLGNGCIISSCHSIVWDDIAKDAPVYVDITPKLYMYIDGEPVPQENIRTEISSPSGYDAGKLYVMLRDGVYERFLVATVKYYIAEELIFTDDLEVNLEPIGIRQELNMTNSYNGEMLWYLDTLYEIDDDNVPIIHHEGNLHEVTLWWDGYVDDEYDFNITAWYGDMHYSIDDHIIKIVEGKYTTLEDAKYAPDIKDNILYGDNHPLDSLKYNFIDEKTFTVFYRFDEESILDSIYNEDGLIVTPRKDTGDIKSTASEDEIDVHSDIAKAEETGTADQEVKAYRFSIKLTGEKRPVDSGAHDSGGFMMTVLGADSPTFHAYPAFDSYYKYGYRTLFALDHNGSPIDLTNVRLNVKADRRANIYDAVSSNKVDFDKEPQNFSNGPVQYTASTGTAVNNFFVDVITQTEGAKLYVNGPSEREIYFNGYGDNHDILIANIGVEPLTGLKAELTDAVNVYLDGYWNIGGEKNDTLAGFTTTNTNEMANLAKVRLIPDGSGEISGKLTITADGQEPVVIDLKGYSGDSNIVTNSRIVSGVKYVPYYAIVATDSINAWNNVKFSVVGDLPDGLEFNSKTGEIFGVPQENGTFEFKIQASFGNYGSTEKSFELYIRDNTNENVFKASDDGYEVITHIGTQSNDYDFTLSTTDIESDQLFVSNGEYSRFESVWLNGVRLIPDEEYTSEAGSTRITIKAQTLQKLTKGSVNTIAAEFRVNSESKELKRTAQNFVITQPASPGGNDKPGGSSGGSSGSNRPGGSSGGSSGNNRPGGSSGGSSGSSRPIGSGTNTYVPAETPSGSSTWEEIEKELRAKPDGGTFEITMRSSIIVPENIVKLAASKNTILKVNTGANNTWLFDCAGVAGDLKPSIGQVLVSIPDSVLNNLSGTSKIPLRIDDADFGKSEKLVYNVGTTFAGQFANLYSYDTSLKYIGSYPIAADGTATMNISNSGRYAIAVDDHTHLAGDMDNSCTLDARDGAIILRYIVGIEELKYASKADVNYDDKVNALDVAFLLKMIVL